MEKTRSQTSWVKWTVYAAAAFIILSVIVFVYCICNINYMTYSTVLIDTDPSIEIRANRKNAVLDITAGNDEAKAVIGDMDLIGNTLSETAVILVGYILRDGYIDESANSVLITVETENYARSSELMNEITNEIDAMFTACGFNGSVISQTMQKNDSVQKLADTNGISIGKAALIKKITEEDSEYDFESLSDLSVNELNLIISTNGLTPDNIGIIGNASVSAYIGEAKARETAILHAELTENEISAYEISMGYEHGTMVYKIEFKSNGYEYEYEINAVTGEIVEFEIEQDDDYSVS